MFDNIDDHSDSIISFSTIIIFIAAISVWISITIGQIDNNVKEQQHAHFISGVRYGTLHYSKSYSMSTSNLKTIAEGYLLKEDIEKYNLASNPVNVDKTKATRDFLEILSGNTLVPVDKLKSMNIYMIHIYSNYRIVSGKVNTFYVVEMFKADGSVYKPSQNFTSINDLSNYVNSVFSVSTDIGSSINQEVHKNQVYNKSGSTGNKDTTYSTFNTYMCIGRNVPISGRFVKDTINFEELQTYSTSR